MLDAPLKQPIKSPVQATTFNPLTNLNLDSFFDVASYSYTDEQSISSSIADLTDNSNDVSVEAGALTYLINGYAGVPTLRKSTDATRWSYEASAYGSGVTAFAFLRVDPSTITGGLFVPFDFSSSVGRLEINDSGDFTYRRDSSNQNIVLAGAIPDYNQLLFIAVYGTSSGMRIRINDVVSDEFIPNAAYTNNNFLRWGDNAAGQGIADFHGWGSSLSVLSDTDLDNLYAWGKARYTSNVDYVSIMVVGDSEAEGRASLASGDIPSFFAQKERVYMWQTDDTFDKIDDPVDANTGAFGGLLDNSGVGFGVHNPLGNNIALNNPYAPVIVPVAKGGRSAEEWNDRNSDNPADTTTYYGCTLTQARKQNNLKAVVLFLGTNDALDGNTPASVKTNIETIISNLRSDLGISDLYFVLVGLHQYDVSFSMTEQEWNDIDTQIEAAATATANCGYVDASSEAGISGDEIHIDVTGYLNIATAAETLITTNAGL